MSEELSGFLGEKPPIFPTRELSLMGGTVLGLNVADLENDLLSGGISLGIAIAAGGASCPRRRQSGPGS